MEGTDIKEKLYMRIQNMVDYERESDEAYMLELIDTCISEEARENYMPLASMLGLRKELYHAFKKLDLLSELLEQESVTEIMINGYDSIFVEEDGKLLPLERRFQSEEKLRDVIGQVVSRCNRIVNETHPIVDARLEDGSRVNVVLPPIALNGPVMTIRRFPKEPITMQRLIEMQSVTSEAADMLRLFVEAGYNIFISGGTGSGKTTFLNALSAYIPATERVVTIEDAAELVLQGIPNLVRLETRQANVEGENQVTIKDLIKSSLRMRPDRVIIGEVRDGAALDMLTAMNTGHDGSLSTGHGNSARDMLRRLETMVMMAADLPLPAIQGQIASAIDILVHLGRLRDKRRCVMEITELLSVSGGEYRLNPLFRFQEADGSREISGNGGASMGGEEEVHGGLLPVSPVVYDEKLKKEGLFTQYEALWQQIVPAGTA